MEDKVERGDRYSLLGYVKGCSILINSLSLCHMRSDSGHCMWSQFDTWSWHLDFHPYLLHPSSCLLQRLIYLHSEMSSLYCPGLAEGTKDLRDVGTTSLSLNLVLVCIGLET